MILTRTHRKQDGIISVLTDSLGVVAWCLEHAYLVDGVYEPKIPNGVYTCVRGPHRLASGPLEAFEVTGIEGHSGIIFHVGNFNADSKGCILVGERALDRPTMVTNSREIFHKFMDIQSDINEFKLTVRG